MAEASPVSPSLPSSPCFFDHLPVELHRIILCMLPDLSSLHSAVLASRTAHAAFALSSQSIQRHIVIRMLASSPQLTTESRWLHAAAYIRRNTHGWHDNMDDFLAYAEPDFDERPPPLPPGDVTAEGLRFHGIVETLTNTFLRTAMQSSRNREATQSEGDYPAFPLQHVERIRIQRGFYRFQRICQMYPRQQRSTSCCGSNRSDHPLREFVRGLPSWELEELRCVYRFLVQNLSFLDRPEVYSSRGPRSKVAGFASYRAREQIVSMGLMFIHKLMTTPPDLQMELLREYCGPGTRPVILSDILPLDGGLTRSNARPRLKAPRADSLIGPSVGWTVFRPSTRTQTEKSQDASCLIGLRDWGYCFWERERLEAWGYYVTEPDMSSPASATTTPSKRPSVDESCDEHLAKRLRVRCEEIFPEDDVPRI